MMASSRAPRARMIRFQIRNCRLWPDLDVTLELKLERSTAQLVPPLFGLMTWEHLISRSTNIAMHNCCALMDFEIF